MSLKTIYLDGASGLSSKLAEAFDLGRRFILPQYDDVAMEDAVSIATSSPHFTLANAGSNTPILAGYTVRWLSGGTLVEKIVASPVTAGSTFDATVAPSAAASGKAIRYSSPRPNSYTSLLADIQAAAAAGKTSFSSLVATVDNPTYLKLNGNYLNAYLAGIYFAMDKEGIYNGYELVLSLDTSDASTTKIKFTFNMIC
jgi:hypothetical protein